MRFFYLVFDLSALVSGVALLIYKKSFNADLLKRAVLAILLVDLPFLSWDFLATKAGHWSFSDKFTTGVKVAALPIEEVLFFLAIPLVCLGVWQLFSTENHYKKIRYSAAIKSLLVTSAFILVVINPRGYTLVVSLSFVGFMLTAGRLRLFSDQSFWLFQIAAVALFIFGNGLLTGLPVVTYGAQAISGIGLGSIPVEDILYNFILINSWVLVTTRQRIKP